MKEQKVLVTGNEYANIIQFKIDAILDEGWLITSVTAQYVATNSPNKIVGGYLIIFEREKKDDI